MKAEECKIQNAKCQSANPPQVVDNFAFCILH